MNLDQLIGKLESELAAANLVKTLLADTGEKQLPSAIRKTKKKPPKQLRKSPFDVLKDAGRPMTQKEIAGVLGVSTKGVNSSLGKALQTRKDCKARRRQGEYLLASQRNKSLVVINARDVQPKNHRMVI